MRRFARLWKLVDRDLQGDWGSNGRLSVTGAMFFPLLIIMLIGALVPQLAPWLVIPIVIAPLIGLAFIGWRAARLNKAARLKLDRAFARRDREMLARQRVDAK